MRVGVDSGGTFTDFVVITDGQVQTFKLRSNPHDPAAVILEGLRAAGVRRNSQVVHGSTVATNALLERKGARTALVTTAGFEDVIEIARQNRRRLYDLNPPPLRPLVESGMRFGIAERTFHDGAIAAPPKPAELRRLSGRLQEAEAIAVCFLHSYKNPENERIVAQALAHLPGFLSISHDVCPEMREYERTSTTVLNGYVGPVMNGYLEVLEREVTGKLFIMQSNGGLLKASEAKRHPVRTLLSGPAGGVVGAVRTAETAGIRNVLGFDMGGTSTDVSLAEGAPTLTIEGSVDGFPVRVPLLDIHTVGAGGGSIARVDAGGLLRVGPESAGADPGPACYGTGDRATVTDAHVVLGRIAPDQFLGGVMQLHAERAERAVGEIARQLGVSLLVAAEAIIRVTNANMQRAIRVISVERGYDPRAFALSAFGGCGGLHACDIAAELAIRTIIFPAHAGVLSALGMLLSDHVRDYSAGVLGAAGHEQIYRSLERRARKETPGSTLARSCDVRYAGQSYEITVPRVEDFHGAHRKLYGYADDRRDVEVVALRVQATLPVTRPVLRATPATVRASERRIYLEGKWRRAQVVGRTALSTSRLNGPVLLVDPGATGLVKEGWTVRCDPSGNALVERV